MLSYLNRTHSAEAAHAAKAAQRGKGVKGDAMESAAGGTSIPEEVLNNAKDGQIIFVPPSPPKKNKKQSPQDAINDFWKRFDSKTPGRG